MTTSTAMFKIEAGIFMWREVRDFLRDCTFRGLRIEWQESSGWLSRDFSIRGPRRDVEVVARAVKAWEESL